jgi:hypothetical protein
MKLRAFLAGLGVLFATSLSFAQGVDEFGAYGGVERRGQERSGQEAAVEIRVGPYTPNVDDNVPNGTPYEDTFGQKQRWHGGLEVDWQVLRIPRLLSFGPGFGGAYTAASAKAPLESGGGRSAQDTTLTIIPLHLVGVLRIDALADRFNVPFCPYAKLGLGYAFWWSKDGEEPARADGTDGKDTSYGLVYSLGVAFRLDWIDPMDAAAADSSIGINHSALFIEYFGSDLDGFGSTDVMQVGTNTYVFGLMLEI